MKPFLFTIGMLLLFIVFLTYQSDHNRYSRQLEHLKQVADECSASAGLFYDKAMYADGKTVYDRDACEEVIGYIIQSNLQLDGGFIPRIHSYWQEQVTYTTHYYDHDNTTFPIIYHDPNGRFTKTIGEPTIIVIINAGRPPYRLAFLRPKEAIRTSAYEYLGGY